MKVAIYGSATSIDNFNKDLIKQAKEIGELLAQKNHIIITGACAGIPFIVAEAAFKLGGKVIGYSPAINKNDHKKRSNDPIEYFTKMIFIPKNYEYVENKMACYKYRNIRTTINCDKAIIIGGRSGTLDEFIKSYEFGKEIGVLKNSKGAANFIEKDLMESSFVKIYKNTGDRIYFEKSPKKLLKMMKLI